MTTSRKKKKSHKATSRNKRASGACITNRDIARMIRELRTTAGFTQREFAKRVGTTAPVICLLEKETYQQHSLSMLNRIAEAVGKCVELRFVSASKRPTSK